MNEGFVMVPRSDFNGLFWEEDRVYSKYEAWLDIQRSVCFKPSKVMIKGKLFILQKHEMVSPVFF